MTDRDYADMINPHVRAEEEAHGRGYREGVAAGIFYAVVALVTAGMLLVALNAHAEWSYEEARRPLKASERGAKISVCQNNATGREWKCFLIK